MNPYIKNCINSNNNLCFHASKNHILIDGRKKVFPKTRNLDLIRNQYARLAEGGFFDDGLLIQTSKTKGSPRLRMRLAASMPIRSRPKILGWVWLIMTVQFSTKQNTVECSQICVKKKLLWFFFFIKHILIGVVISFRGIYVSGLMFYLPLSTEKKQLIDWNPDPDNTVGCTTRGRFRSSARNVSSSSLLPILYIL